MVKKELRFFDITQWREEEVYLRQRHSEGWKLVKVTLPGIYTFEACTPEDVIYRLDYNQEGLANEGEYLQMFADCGWQHILNFVGYAYFCKPAAEAGGEEEIFCDEQSRLDMIGRVFKGRMVPLLCICFCILLPNLFRVFGSLTPDPWDLYFAVFFSAATLLYLVIFLRFAICYHRLRKGE